VTQQDQGQMLQQLLGIRKRYSPSIPVKIPIENVQDLEKIEEWLGSKNNFDDLVS
jgi:hypothetical protein